MPMHRLGFLQFVLRGSCIRSWTTTHWFFFFSLGSVAKQSSDFRKKNDLFQITTFLGPHVTHIVYTPTPYEATHSSSFVLWFVETRLAGAASNWVRLCVGSRMDRSAKRGPPQDAKWIKAPVYKCLVVTNLRVTCKFQKSRKNSRSGNSWKIHHIPEAASSKWMSNQPHPNAAGEHESKPKRPSTRKDLTHRQTWQKYCTKKKKREIRSWSLQWPCSWLTSYQLINTFVVGKLVLPKSVPQIWS